MMLAVLRAPSLMVATLLFSLLAQAAPAASQNPDLSVNGLLLYKNSNRGYDPNSENRNGVSVQEAEMQFASDVDPYWRFVGTFSLSQEADEGQLAQTPSVYSPKWVFEPEEIYAESLDFNAFTLRVGKFKAAMGKHNQLHTHAFPFIDAPLQNTTLLGDEGINDVGASIAVLLPTSWFSEVTIQGFNGRADSTFAPEPGQLVGVAHVKNLWDLSDTLTGELGVSAASGQNTLASSTNIYGADLTFKWRESLERAFIWATEYLKRDVGGDRASGVASWIQFQATRRWWLEARAEVLDNGNQQRKQSALIAYDPSEFSEVRVQCDHLNDGQEKDEHRALLQLNFTIGAHPAHAY